VCVWLFRRETDHAVDGHEVTAGYGHPSAAAHPAGNGEKTRKEHATVTCWNNASTPDI